MVNYRLDKETGISTNTIEDSLSEDYIIPIIPDEPFETDALQGTKFPYVLNFPLITDIDYNFIDYDKPINISGNIIPDNDPLNDKYAFKVIVHFPLANAVFATPANNAGIIVAYNPYVKEYMTFTAQDTDIEISDDVLKQYAPWNNKVIIPQE